MKENKMGTMPVNRLLISMTLPMSASMLVQALYNVVDSIFVAKLSEDALTAVSLAFPMQSLMIAAATGMGVGINSLLSRSLGQKNYERANKAAVNGIFIEMLASVIFILLGADLHESKNIISELFLIEADGVFFYHAGIFKLFDALYDGGNGHVHSLTDS